ncbi:MAG: mobile mystery protein A [Alphaproteobacteria bacterium]|nr:mobile mystery protein A [Alphaproteobacteria bacterium]
MKDAIRHLDQRFKALRPLLATPRPPKGWVRAVRDALGMTTKQLADRIGVAQPRITELEKAELSGSITMNSLERAAEALGCRVVYALVPEHPLSETVTEQAEYLAIKQLAKVQQTMSLENQSVRGIEVQKEMRQKLVRDLLQKPARLWDEK